MSEFHEGAIRVAMKTFLFYFHEIKDVAKMPCFANFHRIIANANN